MKQSQKGKGYSNTFKTKSKPFQENKQLSSTNKKYSQQKLNDIALNKRIVSPEKLKILVLSGNELQNTQLQFLSKCVNLIKLDLSQNNITKLHTKYGIHQITNLRVLNLEANKLFGIQSIEAILGIQSLELFSYKHNPLEQNPKAEHLVVNSFLNLKVLNDRIIFVEQRDPFFVIQRKNEFITREFQEWTPAEHSEKYYLRVLKLHLQYIDNLWMFHNPIIKIQRVWKAVLEEKKISKKNLQLQQKKSKNRRGSFNSNFQPKHDVSLEPLPSKSLLFDYFGQWKKFAQNLRVIKKELGHKHYLPTLLQQNPSRGTIQLQNMQYLAFPLHDYRIMKRNLKIKEQYNKYLRYIRQKIYLRKMAYILRRSIYLKILSFSDPSTSFYSLSGIGQSHRIYFNRVQQHLIENFLAHILKNYENAARLRSQGSFGIGRQYVAVRLMDPDTYENKKVSNPLTYLMWPSMRSVILKKKKYPYKQKSSIIKIKSLSYIKNLNKHLTPEQIKKSIKTYQRVDKFIQYQYTQGLGYYQNKDEFIMKHLIRLVFYHNTKAIQSKKIIQRSEMMSLLQNYDQNVSIYTQKLLQRTTSAVKIQQQWRRYINNKRQSEGIYEKLKKNRAARLIQRFWRDSVFRHRFAFQKNLSLDLNDFNEKDVLVHEELYKKLPMIIEGMKQYIQLYKGLKIQVSRKIILHRADFHDKEIFFPTFRELHLGSFRFGSKDYYNHLNEKTVDIYCFLHQNSNVKIIQCKDQRFYQFTFSSIQEAKLRIACLALLTYRLYGGEYLLLLSKSTLHKYNQRIKLYSNYGVKCKQFIIDEQEQNVNKLRVNILKDINQQAASPFLFLNPNYESIFSHEQKLRKRGMNVQFYQKKYKDYPEKYSDLLTIILNDEQEIKQKAIEEKFLNLQKILNSESEVKRNSIKKQNNILRNNNFIDVDQNKATKINIIRPSVEIDFSKTNSIEKQPKSQNQSISKDKINPSYNINKTSQRRLSLYQIDNSLKQKIQQTHTNSLKNYRTVLQHTQAIKRQKVTKYLQSQKQKRSFFKQRKQIDLSNVRQKHRQQKIMNQTLKSFNQTQRVEMMKKKTQKVKQFKRRSLSNSKREDEGQFMQQGNFIMEQQLKMNLMRNKLKEIEQLKQKRKSQSKSTINPSIKSQSSQTKSFKSNQSIRQKRMIFEGKDSEYNQVNKSLFPSSKNDKINDKSNDRSFQQIIGGQTQPVHQKSFVKKRSVRAGAYIRDPSMVHGVFPEEYYPIESGKGGIIFPRVG